MLPFNPFNRLAIFIVKILFQRFNIPQSLFNLFASLLPLCNVLFRTVGLIPTLRILWYFRRLTFRNTNLEVFLRNLNLNPFVITQIRQTLEPYYTDCLGNLTNFHRLNWILIIYSLLRLFRPSMFKFIKLSIGCLFTTIGILWNESLNSIDILRSLANLIKELTEEYLNITIPTYIAPQSVIENINTPAIHSSSVEEIEKSSKWFTTLGIVLMGVMGVVTILIITDQIYPDSVSEIPYVDYILNPIYHSIESIINFFNPGSPDSSLAEGSNTSNLTDGMISRSISGGSTGSLPYPNERRMNYDDFFVDPILLPKNSDNFSI